MSLERASSARAARAWTCPRCGRAFLGTRSHSCVRVAPEALVAAFPGAAALYPRVLAFVGRLGEAPVEATRTQVSFGAPRRFAFLWIPQVALRRGPPDLFLSFELGRRLRSPRVKQAVEVRPGRWMHHVRIARASDLDDELAGWLEEARVRPSR